MKKLSLFFLLFFSSLTLFAQTSGGPDDFGYTWKSSDNANGPTFSWVDISTLGNDLNLTDDSCSDPINISNGFTFYDNTYNSIYIGSNGWVNFLKKIYSPNHPFIYEGGEPNSLICPFGEDLNTSLPYASVYYYDDTVNNKFIIQYDSIPVFSEKGFYSFEIILDKADSTLNFQYKDTDPTFGWHYNSGTGLPVTGIENSIGTTGLNIDNALLKDNFAIKFYRPAPYIFHDPESISFNDVWVGSKDSLEVTLYNGGKADLIVDSIYFKSGNLLTLDSLPTNFPAVPITIHEVNTQDFEKFFVKYTPLAEGSILDSLIIKSNSDDNNRRISIPINANSLQAEIAVNPSELNYGSVQIEYKDTKDMFVYIQNTGTAGLVINENSKILYGSNFEIVKMPSSFPFTVQPSTIDTMVIRFTPTTTMAYLDTLKLYNSSINDNLITIPLNGKGVESEISFTPESVAFDSTIQGQSDTLSFKVENLGEYTLSVNSMQLKYNQNFSVINTPSSYSIPPGSFRDIQIAFAPTDTINYTDTIVFSTNLPDLYTIPISGIGTLPIYSSSLNYINFGHVLLNNQADSSFSISNIGNGQLVINNIYFESGIVFSLGNTFPFPIKLGRSENLNIDISFLPVSKGYKFDKVKIETNLGTYIVQTQGKGVAPDIEISSNNISYGNVSTTETKTDSIYISNNGDTDLSITAINFENGTIFSLADNLTFPFSVSPGINYKLRLKFSPQDAIAYTDLVHIINNAKPNIDLSLAGNGTYPGMEITPNSISFDSTYQSNTTNQYLYIKNTGNENLVIDSIASGNTAFKLYLQDKFHSKSTNHRKNYKSKALGLTIAPDETKTIRVKFSPTANIYYTANINVYAATLGTQSIPVTGQGIIAEYSITPSSLNFGETQIGESSLINIKIANVGNGMLSLNSFSNQLAQFSIKNMPALPIQIYPGNEINLEAEFTPEDLLAYNDEFTITNNSLDGDIAIPLTGKGIGAVVSLSSTYLDFGNTVLGTFKTDTITLTNTGNIPLNITALSLDGNAFEITDPTAFPLVVDTGLSKKIAVKFTPIAVSNYQQTLSISSDGVLNSANNVNLTGNGVSSDINIYPSHLSFGNIHIDSTKIDSVTISNIGTAELIVSDLVFNTGAAYSLVNPPTIPFTIPIGSSFKIYIKFAAISTQTLEDELNIINNSASNVKVNLSGIGSLGEIAVSTPTLDFENISVGNQLEKDIFIKNTGNYSITINNKYVTGTTFSTNDAFFSPVIAPGDSTKLGIIFTPASNQNYFDFLVLETENNDINVQLLGTGLMGIIELSTQNTIFDDTSIGATSYKDISISNTGNKAVVVSEINLNKAIFSILNISLPDTIEPAQNSTFTIEFSPLLPLDYNDEITIINSTSQNPSISVSGTGIGTNLSISDNLINFNDGLIGFIKKDTITINNSGNINLIIDSLYITQNMDIFTIENTKFALPLILPPNTSQDVVIDFSPQEITGYTSSVKFVSNSYDNIYDYVNLIGFGVSPNIAIRPGNLDYNTVKIGNNSIKYIDIKNTGNAILTIDSLVFKNNSKFNIYSAPSLPFNIEIGNSSSIGIEFTPDIVSNYNDSLTIFNTAASGVYASLSGIGGLANLICNTDSIIFQDVTVGTSQIKSFSLKNTGNYIATVTNISNSTNFFDITIADKKIAKHEQKGLSVNINPGDSVLFNIKFNPTAMQMYQDSIVIESDTDNFVIQLQGKGTKALLTLSDQTINFGSIDVNTTLSDSIIITNYGNSDLVISSLALTNSNGFEITNSLNFPLAIEKNDSITILVDFTPLIASGYNSIIKIVSNNYTQSNNYIYLSGSGKESNIEFNPGSIDYGFIAIGNISVKNFTIKNNGSENVIINSIYSISNPFSIINMPSFPYTLAPNASISLDVRFFPTENIVYEDTIKIETSVTNGFIPLKGTGAYPEIAVSKEEIHFDSTYIANTTIQNFYIKNIGTATLEINALDLSSNIFNIYTGNKNSITNKKSLYEIEPQDSLKIYASFTPQSGINYSDTLNIISSAGNKQVAFFGKGASPAISLNKDEVNFGSISLGETKKDTLILRNQSVLPITISGMVFSENGFWYENLTLPYTLNQLDSVEIITSFTPSSLKHYNAILTISNNSGVNPEIYLHGSGNSNELYISKYLSDFGHVSVDDKIMDSLKIKNNSGNQMSINSIMLSKGIHFALDLSATYPLFIESGDSINLKYHFSPKFYSENTANDTIKINTSIANAQVTLSGTIENIHLDLSPSSLTFDTLEIGNFDTLDIELTNTGLGRIILDDVYTNHPANFSFIYSANDSILAPDSTITIPVIFSSYEIGSFSDSLTFKMNGPTKYISLNGNTKNINLNYSVNSINFDTVSINTPDSISFTIHNQGNSSVNIDNIEMIHGDIFNYFVENKTFAPSKEKVLIKTSRIKSKEQYTILPDSLLAITVIFTPTEQMAYTDSIRIYSSLFSKYIDLAGYGSEDGINDNQLPIAFELYQNYPNPFNPTTTISYQLPEMGKVVFSVYNTIGQIVFNKYFTNMKAGMHNIIFDGSKLSSGVYYYNIKTSGKNIGLKKMLILK